MAQMEVSNVTITGLKELNDLLKALPARIEGNIMRGAMRAGQTVLADAMRENLSSNGHVKTGALYRSIKITYRKKSETQYGWMRSRLTAGDKTAYYARMVEFGTAAHYISVKKALRPGKMTRRGMKKFSISTINRMVKRGSLKIGNQFVGGSVDHPGMNPIPFMRNAFDSHHMAAIDAFANYVRTRLPREIKRLGR